MVRIKLILTDYTGISGNEIRTLAKMLRRSSCGGFHFCGKLMEDHMEPLIIDWLERKSPRSHFFIFYLFILLRVEEYLWYLIAEMETSKKSAFLRVFLFSLSWYLLHSREREVHFKWGHGHGKDILLHFEVFLPDLWSNMVKTFDCIVQIL